MLLPKPEFFVGIFLGGGKMPLEKKYHLFGPCPPPTTKILSLTEKNTKIGLQSRRIAPDKLTLRILIGGRSPMASWKETFSTKGPRPQKDDGCFKMLHTPEN